MAVSVLFCSHIPNTLFLCHGLVFKAFLIWDSVPVCRLFFILYHVKASRDTYHGIWELQLTLFVPEANLNQEVLSRLNFFALSYPVSLIVNRVGQLRHNLEAVRVTEIHEVVVDTFVSSERSKSYVLKVRLLCINLKWVS